MFNKRLFRLSGQTRNFIWENVLCQWISLLANAARMFRLAWFIQKMAEKKAAFSDLWPTLALLAAVVALRAFLRQKIAAASFYASSGIKKKLRTMIYEKLLELGPAYTETLSTAEAVQVATEGVDQLETYFGGYLPQLFYSLLAPVTLFFLLAPVSLPAAAALLLCVPLIPISIAAVQKIAKRLLGKYWSAYASLGDKFLENIQGMTSLKIYQADGAFHEEMNRQAESFRKITMKVLTMQLNSIILMDLVAYGGSALGAVLAVSGLAAGHLGLAGALVILLLSAEFFLPLRALGSFFHVAMNGVAASEKIFRILDMPVPAGGTEALPASALSVEFEDVNFSYGTDRPVLQGITWQARPGQLVSLVGESGCGKSTAAGLLVGNLRGYDGSIRIGGMERSFVRAADLRCRGSLVTHNGYLFTGTVAENLRMARPQATDEEMLKALKEVCLDDFLAAQQGLDTAVAERGSNLSGGQRQRLNLARALLRDSDLYVFDEVTSNIDVESETLIMELIHRLAGRKTVILISHRLANVVSSDTIYLLENGRITEQGSHDELLKLNGGYAALFREQQALESYGRTEAEHEKKLGL